MDNNLFHAQMRPFGFKLSWHRNENTFGFVVRLLYNTSQS